MGKSYALTKLDRSAVFQAANRLDIDPYSFGAILQQESGMNPNIWGGQGGNYYGAIQFGGPERQEAGLNPEKIGSYTLAEQMPHIEKWLSGRGFKPGMGTKKLYATILGGNPDADIDAKDSFGTSVRGSLEGFAPGGKNYTIAQQKLGDNLTVESQAGGALPSTKSNLSNGTQPTANNFIFNYIYGDLGGKETKKEEKPKSLTERLKEQLFMQTMSGSERPSLARQLINQIKSGAGYANPLSLLESYYSGD